MDRILRKLQNTNEINHPSNYSAISLAAYLDTIRRTFLKTIEQNNVTFKTDIPKELTFNSYPRLVEIILSNLIENALFYAALKKENSPEILVKASKSNGHVEFSIQDNGVGIDPEVRTRIWDMFFVGNERSKGNGLGLYLTRKSVEALKGQIIVQSEQYVYTRFVVTIPTEN
jgi:signal transduction histidine kinase